MIIKKYSEFIVEKMGVPRNIVESATKLYELIVDKFIKIDSEHDLGTIASVMPNQTIEFQLTIPIKIVISDLEFSTVYFNISVYLNPKYKNVDVISWGVSIAPTSHGDYRIIHDKSLVDSLNLFVNFISDSSNKISDIVTYLKSERSKTIGILSHELKHVYDKYMIGYELLGDIVDYQTFASNRTGFDEIDKFIYLLYGVSHTENLVRPSEIAGQIESSGITKSEFKEFLEGNRLYKELLEIKYWSYNKLKSDLKKNIKTIRSRFDDIPESETDENVIDFVLNSSYESIVGMSSDTMVDILGLNNKIKILKDIDFYNSYISKRIFKNVDEFFLFWEKKLNFEGEKMIKKIAKIYDMCKDDNVNQLMSKINDRVDGQYIVNLQAYNEVILKSKENKVKYKK